MFKTVKRQFQAVIVTFCPVTKHIVWYFNVTHKYST